MCCLSTTRPSAWTTDSNNTVVPAIRLGPSMTGCSCPRASTISLYAAAQNIFLGDDVVDEMARLDEAFDVANS